MFLRRSERAGGFYSECLSGGMLFSTGAVAVEHWCGAGAESRGHRYGSGGDRGGPSSPLMRKFHVEQPHYHCLKLAPRMLAAYSEHHVSNPTSIARKRSIRFGLSEGSATFWSMQQLKLFLSQLISDTLGISASNCCVMTHCVNYFGAVDAPLAAAPKTGAQ